MTVRSNEAPSCAPTFFSLRHTLFLYCNLAKVINRLLPIWRNTSLLHRAHHSARRDDDDALQQCMCLNTCERGCIWCNWVHSWEGLLVGKIALLSVRAAWWIIFACQIFCALGVGMSFNVNFLMMRIEWNSRNVFAGLPTNNESTRIWIMHLEFQRSMSLNFR